MLSATAPPSVIDMPNWRPIARHALRTTLIVSLLPMAVFYASMSFLGIRVAVLVTVGWFYGGLLLRIVRRKPLLAAGLLAAALLSVRAAVMFLSGSPFLYFLQPVAGTVIVATVFATSAALGRPVLDKIAHEFCPFPPELSDRLRDTPFFIRLSIVWSTSYLINAAGTIWLLTSASINGFVLVKSVMSPLFTLAAVGASYLMFRTTTRAQNIHLRWTARPAV